MADPASAEAQSPSPVLVPSVTLGRTGLVVSRLAFGAGPVSGLMTGDDDTLQRQVVSTALQCGINWFDTAAGYGNGASETNLARALRSCGSHATAAHVATKVRVDLQNQVPVSDQIRRNFDESLSRLQTDHVTLIQLHNGITQKSGAEPSSVSDELVLSRGGVADVLDSLRDEGITRFTGLTGTGNPEALRRVIRSGRFDTVQLPYHRLNPSAGCDMPAEFADRNYGNILADCLEMNLGVFAIRVFAAGALLNQPPSQHTLKTQYFPLDLYVRDRQRAAGLATDTHNAVRQAIEFVLSHPAIHSAIIGFGRPDHVLEAAAAVMPVAR